MKLTGEGIFDQVASWILSSFGLIWNLPKFDSAAACRSLIPLENKAQRVVNDQSNPIHPNLNNTLYYIISHIIFPLVILSVSVSVKAWHSFYP